MKRGTPNHDAERYAIVEWNLFDPAAEVAISACDRPHWDQCGALTFVTFRLADSMPKSVIAGWLQELEEWLDRNGVRSRGLDSERRAILSHDSPNCGFDLPEHLGRAFTKFRNQRWHENLDQCHGSCLLRQRQPAQIFAESVLKFDGDRYDLERFVVMPNHVHMLVQMRTGWGLRKQCESWMRFNGWLPK